MKSFQCSQCDNTYFKYSDLVEHIFVHISPAPDLPENNSQNVEMPYLCHLCETTFWTNNDLQNHFMLNTPNIRENYCTKQSNPKNHISGHTGGKPYKCKQCDKSFIEESILLSHQVAAHGYRAHKCEPCEIALVQLSLCNCNNKPPQFKNCEKTFSKLNKCHNDESFFKFYF